MKNGAVVLGIFILAGLVVGAFIISLYGQEKPQGQDLKPLNDKVSALAGKIDALEQGLHDLNGKLESNLALIQENERSIREFKGQLAEAGKGEEDVVAKTIPFEGGEVPPVRLSDGLDNPDPAVIERLKEEVKKEIKEESKIAKKESNVAGARKWMNWQTTQLRKKMDDDFTRMAEKLELDRNQEIAVREIGEQILEKITNLWSDWEERLASATDEDWGEFKGELGGIYRNAERQLGQHVNEEQSRAIMRFIREDGK
jgi:predicted  nucleic acid-binding Zn-ribbon protein